MLDAPHEQHTRHGELIAVVASQVWKSSQLRRVFFFCAATKLPWPRRASQKRYAHTSDQ